MPEVIKNMLSSKKFVFVLLVSVIAVVSAHYGVITKPETIAILTLLWPMYLGSQGVADIGDKIGQWKAKTAEIRKAADTEHNNAKASMIQAMIPVIMEALKMKVGGISTAPVGEPILLKKGQKVIHFDLGPEVVGVIERDQLAMDNAVLVRFEGKNETMICALRDLVAVPDDFVPPKAADGNVKHQGTA